MTIMQNLAKPTPRSLSGTHKILSSIFASLGQDPNTKPMESEEMLVVNC